jgi:hypothetical protein
MQGSQQLTMRAGRPRRVMAVLPVLLLATSLTAAQDATSPPSRCSVHFIAELSPDVPNPRDGGFVSSLLGDHSGYRLYLRHVIDDTHLDMLLLGPGPKRNCRDVVESIRKDSRIQSLEVQQ